MDGSAAVQPRDSAPPSGHSTTAGGDSRDREGEGSVAASASVPICDMAWGNTREGGAAGGGCGWRAADLRSG
nr:unnamed protein product [Digitaria exilis]